MVFENVDFTQMIRSLEQMGFYDVILPFLLVFSIFFGVLQKVNLFGKTPQAKNINIIVAFVTAFFVLRVPSIIAIINQFLPNVSLIVIVLLMFLLILGIFGTNPEGWQGVPFMIAIVVALGGVVWAIFDSLPGTSRHWMPRWLYLTPSDKGILLAIGFFVIILLMFKEKKEGKKSFGKWISDEFTPEKFGRKKG